MVHGRPLGGRELRRPGRTRTAAPPASADRSAGATFRLAAARCPPIGPGSWQLIARTPRPPAPPPADRAARPAGCRAGSISTEPLKDTIRRVVPERLGRPPEPLDRRLRLRDRPPRRCSAATTPRDADLADAVAASCAIPGFYRPVEIAGAPLRRRRPLVHVEPRRPARRGPRPRHLPQPDLVAAPAARLEPGRARRRRLPPRLSGRRLGSEAKKLRAAGTEVVLVQPTTEDLAVMGANLMSTRNRHEVIETAIRTVGRAAARARACASCSRASRRASRTSIARPDGPAVDLAAGSAARPQRRRPGRQRLGGAWPQGATPQTQRGSSAERRVARNGGDRARARTAAAAVEPSARACAGCSPTQLQSAHPDRRPRRARPRLHPRDAARRCGCSRASTSAPTSAASTTSRPRARCCSSATTRAATSRRTRTVFTLAFTHLLRRRAALLPARPQPRAGDARARLAAQVRHRRGVARERAEGARHRRRAARLPGRRLRGPPARRGSSAKVDFDGRKGFIRLALEQGRADRPGRLDRRPGDGALPDPRRAASRSCCGSTGCSA